MNHEAAAYGLWTLVVIDSFVFILFAIRNNNILAERLIDTGFSR